MTKQGEIREGIAEMTENRFRAPAEEAGLAWDKNFNYRLASDILSYLHKQDVVIKVDYYVDGTEVNCPNCHSAFLDKVESLVEEK